MIWLFLIALISAIAIDVGYHIRQLELVVETVVLGRRGVVLQLAADGAVAWAVAMVKTHEHVRRQLRDFGVVELRSMFPGLSDTRMAAFTVRVEQGGRSMDTVLRITYAGAVCGTGSCEISCA